ncbi:MAG: hypothetical protein WAK82_06390 [Streptosporangiaceae bacterium]
MFYGGAHHEAGRFFPEQWHRYAADGGYAENLVAAYEMTGHMMSALNRFART